MSNTRSLRFFFKGFLPILLWACVLSFWAFQSSRQITLRRAQFLNADYIVTAHLDSLEKKTVLVEKEWLGKNESKVLTVENLEMTDTLKDRSFLIPLERVSQTRYRIVPAFRLQNRPMIYPSTNETENQLREILKTKR